MIETNLKDTLLKGITTTRVAVLTLALAFGLFAFAAPQPVFAGHATGERCRNDSALSAAEKGTCLADPHSFYDADATDVDGLIANIINIFSLVVGVISVIMIIVGGLKYILSAGDASNVTSAKNTILYAVVGLVIVAFAQVIVRFVLTSVT